MDSLSQPASNALIGDGAVDEITDGVSRTLRLGDDQKKNNISNAEKMLCLQPSDEEDEEEEEEVDPTAEILAQSGYYEAEPQKTLGLGDDQKKNNVRNAEKMLCLQPDDEEEEDEDEEEEDDLTAEILAQSGYYKAEPLHTPTVSLRSDFKPASALKGSREKQGITPEERSVTWAPDVYDPIPTSPSRFATSKIRRRRMEDKNDGKHKQKGGGKASGGAGAAAGAKGKGKGKDKKEARKRGGCYNKRVDSGDGDD